MGVAKRAWVLTGLATGLLPAFLVLALASCGPKVKTASLNTDQAGALCSALDTAAEVKNLIFEQADKQTAASNRLALAQLAKQANLRITAPLLDAYDEDTRKTTCSGQLHISLPAGAVRNLGDTSDLTAAIKYSSQPATDRVGVNYQVTGADNLISGIAGADISEWAAHLQPNGMPAEGAPVPAAAPTPPPSAAPPVIATVGAPPTPPSVFARPSVPPGRAQVAAAAPAAPGPPPLPRCRWARSYADRTICGDPALEAEDRRILALYRNAQSQDPTGEVRRVGQSERAAREGCQDRECIREWFRQREADLSPQ